jgi:hypothetical protein
MRDRVRRPSRHGALWTPPCAPASRGAPSPRQHKHGAQAATSASTAGRWMAVHRARTVAPMEAPMEAPLPRHWSRPPARRRDAHHQSPLPRYRRALLPEFAAASSAAGSAGVRARHPRTPPPQDKAGLISASMRGWGRMASRRAPHAASPQMQSAWRRLSVAVPRSTAAASSVLRCGGRRRAKARGESGSSACTDCRARP